MNLSALLRGLQDKLRICFITPQYVSIDDADTCCTPINGPNLSTHSSDIEEVRRILSILRAQYNNLHQIVESSLHLETTAMWQRSLFEFELILSYKFVPVKHFALFPKNCTLLVLLSSNRGNFEFPLDLPFRIVPLFLPIADLQLEHLWQFVDFWRQERSIEGTVIEADPLSGRKLPDTSLLFGERSECTASKSSVDHKDLQETLLCGATNLSVQNSSQFGPKNCPNSLAHLQRVESILTASLSQCISRPGDEDRNFSFPSLEDDFRDAWNFDAHSLVEDKLFAKVLCIFTASGCFGHLSVPKSKFLHFLRTIQCNYFSNSYHNFRHAVDTAQAAFHLYKKSGYSLSHLDLLALLVACIGHDVGHFGINNSFLIHTSSPLSKFYNDKSILENFHSTLLSQILSESSCNFVSHLSAADSCKFRSTIIAAILATDMSLHFDYMEELDSRLALLDKNSLDMSSDRDMLLLIISIIKCADISNVARPLPVATQWADALLDEMFIQGDQEKRCSVQTCSLNSGGASNKAQSQVNFIGQFAIPFYSLVNRLFADNMNDILTLLRSNFTYWQDQLHEDTGGKHKTSQISSPDHRSSQAHFLSNTRDARNDLQYTKSASNTQIEADSAQSENPARPSAP